MTNRTIPILIPKDELKQMTDRLPSGWLSDLVILTKVNRSTIYNQITGRKPRKDGSVMVYSTVWDSAIKLAEEHSVKQSRARERIKRLGIKDSPYI